MSYNILFTSLFAAAKDEPMRYYFANDGERRIYTDAMLTIEGATKYILSREHIDEILILGRRLTFDAGDDERVLGADDGKSFYTSDINELSTYSLFRYRLSQYIDELRIEQHDIMDTLTPDEQKAVENAIRNYYNTTGDGNKHRKFKRFFDELVTNPPLYDGLRKALAEEIPDFQSRRRTYIDWVKNYLYMNLKDTSKMEILPGNENASVRFVPTTVTEDGMLPIDSILRIVNSVAAEQDVVNIYIALSNDDMTDNFLILSILDILDTMYGKSVTVMNVLTTSDAHFQLAGMVRNDTEAYGITSLVAATKTFLKYGKVDMIVDCWESSLSKNDQVEKMIYAMRRIDTGLSLCNISDIERGIQDLKDLFNGGFDLSNSDYYSKIFMLMAEGIRKDYGNLLAEGPTNFIDLVKWAYSKGFYQQCLTIIEARTPRQMISMGMYYYCDDENDRERVTEIFAAERSEMKPHEYWKMNDLDHYFIKYHTKFRLPPTSMENNRENAHDYVALLGNNDPAILTPCSVCDDRKALENLIFAYFHVGRIRNETNHAEEVSDDGDSLFTDVRDVSAKMVKISEGIEYFINCYDIVEANVRDKDPHVVRIDVADIKAVSKRIERERAGERRSRRD